jgi:hypothetical protein
MKLFIYLLSVLDRIHDFFVPKEDLILDDDLKALYVPDEEEDAE